MMPDTLRTLAEHLRSRKRIPVATYRLQFNPAFTFRDAQQIVSYLSNLGITDCYASPYLKARPGSPHGYDVCDHQALNPELGTERDYDAFVAELKRHQMGQIVDVVPNHMSIWETSNALWMDVLENGPSSPYASFFDVDWHPLRSDTDLENRVLLPILGSSYGDILENQELSLAFDEGAFFVRYYEHRLPLDPGTYGEVLQMAEEEMARQLGPEDGRLLEMKSIRTAAGHLPPRSSTEPEQLLERQREKEVVKRRLKKLCDDCPVARRAVEGALQVLNGSRGNPESFDRLDHLLDRQVYRLADWRVAAEEINYRRFFDINDLAALRTEDPDVFDHTHRLVLRLLREGKATGLRIDHPDGLWDPARYFERLQAAYLLEVGPNLLSQEHQPTGAEWDGLKASLRKPIGQEAAGHLFSPGGTPLYVVVEKILSGDETLPRDWAVDGTTGYDFAYAANGLFVDEAARRAFDTLYKGFTGRDHRFGELVNAVKKTIISTALASEVNMLAHQLKRIAARSRKHRDFTLNSIAIALRETIASLPIYRTYVGEGSVDPRDRQYVENAIAEAKRRNRRVQPIIDFLRDTLLLQWPEGHDGREETISFVYKFQQVTGPVTAKALEDTVLYLYNRLISLNEVGGNPGQFGVSTPAFHQRNLDRREQWPHALLCTSTHDTKRSEDVRARIDVLSEMPEEWRAALYRWNRLNRRHKALWEGRAVPDRNEEYYLYQTLLGAWPLGVVTDGEYQSLVERMESHMVKALREGKASTSWANPDADYEERALAFVRAILDRSKENPFLEDFRAFQRKAAHYGIWNSLSQTLLKIASPGVPDFYQGTEIWDFSLVDPDNRRPVDYALRMDMLKGLRRRIGNPRLQRARLARELVETRDDGRIKMYLIHVALTYRREQRDLFQEGAYLPLEGTGRQAKHLCAFAREKDSRAVVVAVPRLVVGLTRGERVPPVGSEVWGASQMVLPPGYAGGQYRNLFTDEVVQPVALEGGSGLPLASAFASFPVALLERVDSRSPMVAARSTRPSPSRMSRFFRTMAQHTGCRE